MQTIAGGLLRDLADERLRVMQHDGVEGATPKDLVLKARGPHTKEVAGHLTECLVPRAPSAEKHLNADHAFVAHGGDLDRIAVRHGGDD